MAMLLNVIIALSSLLTVNAFFLPDCIWDSDWDIPEEKSQSRRYRRFLWDDSDVCDWMCDPDLLPHEICNSCCRREATPRPPSSRPQLGGPNNQNTNAQPAASPQTSPNGATNVVQQTNTLPNTPFQLQVPVPVEQGWPLPQPDQNWVPNQVWQQQPQPLDQNWQQSPQPQNQNWQQSPQPPNQNWQQSPQPQNQNWQQSPQPQNQNWQQSPQPQNQNWQQSPQPQNQNWQQSPQPPNQNWQQSPQPQNQNWQQPPQVLNQNWNSQAQPSIPDIQVPTGAQLNNEPFHVQVPINLTGVFQAQVPSRLTTVFQNQPGVLAQGQLQGVSPTTVRPNQPPPSVNGAPASESAINGMTLPQNRPNGMLPLQPQVEPTSAGSQQPQQAGVSQQFQTAAQEGVQPETQPQNQSPPPQPEVIINVPSNTDGGDGQNNADDGDNAT